MRLPPPHHRRRGRRGGRHHRRPVLAPTQPPSPSAAPHCHVLDKPPSPSPDRLTYRPMEPSDPNATPWGHWGTPCAIHGWGCPNRVTPVQGPSSSTRQGEEEEGGEEEDDECHITVVTGPVGAPTIHRRACISIGPRGQSQRPLAPRSKTTPPTSLTLAAPPPPPSALPSPKGDLPSSGTLPEYVESVRQPSDLAVHPLHHPV
jgi:hypothetical protein